DLPDWVIGAGFVRNPVWDHLHGREPVLDTDVDLVYFDRGAADKEAEKRHEAKLKGDFQADWSVKNQARMHLKHGDDPYENTEDALAHWVETATCIGVRLDRSGDLILVAPHGIDDLVNLVVRPGPLHSKPEQVVERIREKHWLERWPKLRLTGLPE
ncbi:MAG TPA: nucleotidyltransferase family protein, partial [Patescibacteria group bacterium]